MSNTLGFMQAKSDKQIGDFFNLEINLPFSPKMEFFVQENAKKNSPEANDNAPDYLVYYAKNRVGAVWKRTSKNGSNEYLSCEIVAPLSSQGKLNFALFPDREKEGRFNVSFSEPVSKEKQTKEPNEEEVPY
ncbi:DUF736 family protein [Leptospira stimsonii]|uniref:DUF736 family protein n=1 Tax=Leptospira stimsonii TaxID=2202203 RepID=A0ABY2MV29_9LEPT|nr:DUF736 family protein [Leptospira stimsonii]TGK25389.1 DUF736 family protein [Leptospira stimsonii]TGM08808.1 DUF736 family protein [Leptospira stimsonii]